MPFARATVVPALMAALLSCSLPPGEEARPPMAEPGDFFGDDYVMTVAGNGGKPDLGPAEWWRVSEDRWLLRGYYRVASGDPRSGVHRLLLRRTVRESGAVYYELEEDVLE